MSSLWHSDEPPTAEHLREIAQTICKRIHGRALHIGYIVGEKKKERIFLPLINYAKEVCGDRILFMDLSEGLPEHIDIVWHKIDAYLDDQDPQTMLLHNLESKLKHTAIFVDDVMNVRFLYTRSRTFEKLQFLCRTLHDHILVPPFLYVPEHMTDVSQEMNSCGIHFPAICKPNNGDHEVTLIVSQEGVTEARSRSGAVLLQRFIPHGGVLFKVDVIGSTYTISTRNSLDRADVEHAMGGGVDHIWNFGRISAGALTEKDRVAIRERAALKQPRPPPRELVSQTVEEMRKLFGLRLFNFDWVVEEVTGRHYIVDVNYFPGYKDTVHLPNRLLHFILNVGTEATEQRRLDDSAP